MPQVGVKFMSADKISHYMMSAMFLSRANAAVRKAVDRLKAKGIEPAYVIRCPEDAAQEVSGQFSGEYINADDIARLLQDPISDDHRRNIKAAQIAQERRLQALHEGRDF